MNSYAVAVCYLSSNQNNVVLVNANSEMEAIIRAVEKSNIYIGVNNVEELIQYYYDGDICVSIPMLLE